MARMSVAEDRMPAEPLPAPSRLEDAVGRGVRALLDRQQEDGHWVFVLEADATIPAEYILLKHFLDEIDRDIEARLAT